MPDMPPDPPAPIAAEHAAVMAAEEIDIVAAANFRILPPRDPCARSEPGVIVVCGPRPAEEYRIDLTPAEPRPTAMEEIGERLRLRFGPADAGIETMAGPAGGPGVGVNLHIRF